MAPLAKAYLVESHFGKNPPAFRVGDLPRPVGWEAILKLCRASCDRCPTKTRRELFQLYLHWQRDRGGFWTDPSGQLPGETDGQRCAPSPAH